MSVQRKSVSTFTGLKTSIKDPLELKDGTPQDALNWLTGPTGDHIELRGGTKLLGQTRNAGTGKVTGLKVATTKNGKEVLFFSYGQSIKYYDSVADDTVEVGTNLLPAAASGEDVAMESYANIAGDFIYISSPHSSIYKIPVANPGSAVDQGSSSFKGYIKIKQSRMFLWNRLVASSGFLDKTGLSLSYIDKNLLSAYTTVSNENIGTGDGNTKTFNATLTQRTGVRTVFTIYITDTNENFTDNNDGTLTGSKGGTGMINYATGAISVTFNTAPAGAQPILCTYLWEDATSNGICDFSYGSPRSVGQGDYFRQDDGGGAFMNLYAIGGDLICLHALKSWDLNLTANDTNSTNIPYRDKVNMPYWRAGDETDDGILAIFIGDKNYPKLGILQIGQYTTTIVPQELSADMDFTAYGMDFPIVKRWGNYDLLCLQNQTSGVNDPANNVMFARNIISGWFDKLDYSASVLDSYLGDLAAGDSVSNNVFLLFSGVDDDGQAITNYWTSGQSGLEMTGTKKYTILNIDGYIAKDQILQIYEEYDNGDFVLIGTITGQDACVDTTQGTTVGSQTVGMQVVGGGSVPNAYHFEKDLKVCSPLFEEVTIKFVANGIGALQINSYERVDIRTKGNRSIPIYSN